MKSKSWLISLIPFCLLGSCEVQNSSNIEPKEEYVYEKLWETKTVHDETLCLYEQDDGSISNSLLFTPTKILSVKDYSLKKEFVEGSDYVVEGNRIVRTHDSKIPFFTKDNIEGRNLPKSSGIGTLDGKRGKIMFTEGIGIIMYQISVTYTHQDVWEGIIPTFIGDKLPNFQEKLTKEGDLSIVFYGDSIMTGCNSSAKLGVPPFLEIYPDAVRRLLQRNYPKPTIKSHNPSVGGWLSKNGLDNLDNSVNRHKPDLVFLGFGMNDGTFLVKPSNYVKNIESMIQSIKGQNPKAEIVVLSTILANPDSIQDAIQEKYLDPLKEMTAKKEGVALLDMTSYSKYLLAHKKSFDILANNVNHPSDFLVRQYVTNVMEGVDPKF